MHYYDDTAWLVHHGRRGAPQCPHSNANALGTNQLRNNELAGYPAANSGAFLLLLSPGFNKNNREEHSAMDSSEPKQRSSIGSFCKGNALLEIAFGSGQIGLDLDAGRRRSL